MKINRLFSIAAAALMLVACSSEETALNNNPAAGSKMQFTATIAAPGSAATTRTEYSEVTEGEAAGTINVAWKVGDEIALIHGNVKDVATVKTINADGSATINGYVTGAKDEDWVYLNYPAARMIPDVEGGYKYDPEVDGKLLTQDGTLKYIQDNLDFRESSGQLSVSGTEVTLTEPVKMLSVNAIWKLALQDDAEPAAALAASQVTIKNSSGDMASATLSTATSEMYLALNNVGTVNSLTIEATVGEDTYTYTRENVRFDNGKFYQSTASMTKQEPTIDLSTVTEDITIEDGLTVTGKLAGNYKVSIADGATVILDGITINGVHNNSYKWAGLNCAGNATIILKDGSTNTVKGFYATYPGVHVLPGKTLIIKGETLGTGKLIASSNSTGDDSGAAGIGGGDERNCGNIEIQGGDITATGSKCNPGIGSGYEANCGTITISGGTIKATGGSEQAAGIGSGWDGSSCGNITITGGTIEATGGGYAAGIGSGADGSSCGNITITDGVTLVKATKGGGAPYSIGAGKGSSCGTVTIGGKEGAISESPFTYPAPAVGDVTVDSYAGGGDPIATPQ